MHIFQKTTIYLYLNLMLCYIFNKIDDFLLFIVITKNCYDII
jgi:hypothetical protein